MNQHGFSLRLDGHYLARTALHVQDASPRWRSQWLVRSPEAFRTALDGTIGSLEDAAGRCLEATCHVYADQRTIHTLYAENGPRLGATEMLMLAGADRLADVDWLMVRSSWGHLAYFGTDHSPVGPFGELITDTPAPDATARLVMNSWSQRDPDDPVREYFRSVYDLASLRGGTDAAGSGPPAVPDPLV